MRRRRNCIDAELREAEERRKRWEQRQRDGVAPDKGWRGVAEARPWERVLWTPEERIRIAKAKMRKRKRLG